MKKRFASVAALVLALSALLPTVAVADSGAASFAYLAGCEIGKVPGGQGEGVRLAVQGGGPNFNSKVSGFTVFVKLP